MFRFKMEEMPPDALRVIIETLYSAHGKAADFTAKMEAQKAAAGEPDAWSTDDRQALAFPKLPDGSVLLAGPVSSTARATAATACRPPAAPCAGRLTAMCPIGFRQRPAPHLQRQYQGPLRRRLAARVPRSDRGARPRRRARPRCRRRRRQLYEPVGRAPGHQARGTGPRRCCRPAVDSRPERSQDRAADADLADGGDEPSLLHSGKGRRRDGEG